MTQFGEGATGTYIVVVTVSDGELQDSVQFQWTITSAATMYPVYLPLITR